MFVEAGFQYRGLGVVRIVGNGHLLIDRVANGEVFGKFLVWVRR